MRYPRQRGATSVMVTVFIPDSSVSNGAGLTTLTSASTNLIVGYRRELDAAFTEYKQSAGNIEAQTTIGTYQAPSTSAKIRIKHIARGQYEIQFHNSATAFGTADTSQAIVVEIYEETTSALNIGPNAAQIPLVGYNPQNGPVDALNTDTYAEPTQGAPAATTTLAQKINYLYKAWRNRHTQTASEFALYADDTTTKDQKATVSDDGTTLDRGEIGTGA